MLYIVTYWLPEYSKVAFPGQVFLPQRTYTTPPVGYLRPSPEDGSEAERSEMKCEDNNRLYSRSAESPPRTRLGWHG